MFLSIASALNEVGAALAAIQGAELDLAPDSFCQKR